MADESTYTLAEDGTLEHAVTVRERFTRAQLQDRIAALIDEQSELIRAMDTNHKTLARARVALAEMDRLGVK